MSQIAQVRINKTKEVKEVLTFLRSLYKYKLLDDSELIKVALSELYSKAMKDISINDEGHPYYNTLTPEEEAGLAKSMKSKLITKPQNQSIADFLDEIENNPEYV